MVGSAGLTIDDLQALPQPLDDTRYELIDGELYVSTQPSAQHQIVGFEIGALLRDWNRRVNAGTVIMAPGIVFARHEAVAPDLVWVSRERLRVVLGDDGKLHAAPDLVVEVLSPGPGNEERDRVIKLDVYSRRGVREYWVVDWCQRSVEVYRRERAALRLVSTLHEHDTLESPLFPGFSCRVADFFASLP